MKKSLVISSTNPGGLSAKVDFRFGRCATFTNVIIDDENDSILQVNIIVNDGKEAFGDAGILAAECISKLNPTDLVTGKIIGDRAYTAIKDKIENIEFHLIKSQNIIVNKIVELFIDGTLTHLNENTLI